MTCRICLEPGGQAFCKCKGSSGLVHHACLKKWLQVSHRETCEICQYKFKMSTRPQPTCTLSSGDVLLAETPAANVFMLSIAFLFASIFVCMYFILHEYLSVTISWIIANLVVTLCAYNNTHPVNIFIFYTCVTTVTTGFFATGNRTEHELVLSSILCMYTLVVGCLVWIIRYIFYNCFANTVSQIMVYNQTDSSTNVDTRVHTDKPEPQRSTQIVV